MGSTSRQGDADLELEEVFDHLLTVKADQTEPPIAPETSMTAVRSGYWLSRNALAMVAALLCATLVYLGTKPDTHLPPARSQPSRQVERRHETRSSPAASQGASPAPSTTSTGRIVVTQMPSAEPRKAAWLPRGRRGPSEQIARGDLPAKARREPARSLAASCTNHSSEDACIYHDMLQADERLRAAYSAAVESGAPRPLLSSVNREWRRAREMSLESPDEAIRRYDDLARSLGELRWRGER